MGRPKVFPHYFSLKSYSSQFNLLYKSSPLEPGHYDHNHELYLALDHQQLSTNQALFIVFNPIKLPRNFKRIIRSKATHLHSKKSAELSI